MVVTLTTDVDFRIKNRNNLIIVIDIKDTTPATQQTFPHTTTQSRNIKTNMLHIHTSIVSMYLATRGNYKIMRTPQPHISSSEEILPRLICRTLAQFRTNKSPFLKACLHKVDAKSHTSPLCPLCITHTDNTHHLFNCIHICHPWICGQAPPE